MVKSMTGYGRASELIDGMMITVEIKSVNHRYFEFSPRVYRTYSFLEEKLKPFVKSFMSRGKIDCNIQIEVQEGDDCVVQVNHSLASGYIQAFKELSERYDIEADDVFELLASKNDIYTIHKAVADEEKIWEAVQKVLTAAIESFMSMRLVEGEKLKADVLECVDTIFSNVEFIENRSPKTVVEYNEKLKARIKELIGDVNVDEQRLLTEAAIFADKIAVAEETVRLRSHFAQLRNLLETDKPIGKDLDFLLQEINRETNTIGSKASDLEITKCVLEMKSNIEKIREQIQNIE